MKYSETIQKILTHWENAFSGSPDFIVKAPGRINLIGEHTDYNNGLVLPAAINLGVYSAINFSPGEKCTVIALDKNERYEFSIGEVPSILPGSWQNYIIGVVEEIRKTGKEMSSFNMMFSGDIPIGAGLSSSAALEISVAYGLNVLFGLELSLIEMILIGQRAEHNYVGVQCGIMDQYTSVMGKENHLVFLDCSDNSYKPVPINLDKDLVLVHSGVQHNLAASEYNLRRQQCESAVKKIQASQPQVTSLRDVDSQMIEQYLDDETSEEYRRAKYIVEENERVNRIVQLLENKQAESIGDILFAAHKGMRELYEITCAETDFLVEKAKESHVVLGARQMGGGFGGCTLNLIEKGRTAEFVTEALRQEYKERFNCELSVIPVVIDDGVNVIWSGKA